MQAKYTFQDWEKYFSLTCDSSATPTRAASPSPPYLNLLLLPSTSKLLLLRCFSSLSFSFTLSRPSALFFSLSPRLLLPASCWILREEVDQVVGGSLGKGKHKLSSREGISSWIWLSLAPQRRLLDAHHYHQTFHPFNQFVPLNWKNNALEMSIPQVNFLLYEHIWCSVKGISTQE